MVSRMTELITKEEKIDQVFKNRQTSRMGTFNKQLYDMFYFYLDNRTSKIPVPNADELADAGLYVQSEPNTTRFRESMRSKFKAWSKKLKIVDNRLVHSVSNKKVLSRDELIEEIFRVHSINNSPGDMHISASAVYHKMEKTISMGSYQFGLNEDDVRHIVKQCTDSKCAMKRVRRLPNLNKSPITAPPSPSPITAASTTAISGNLNEDSKNSQDSYSNGPIINNNNNNNKNVEQQQVEKHQVEPLDLSTRYGKSNEIDMQMQSTCENNLDDNVDLKDFDDDKENDLNLINYFDDEKIEDYAYENNLIPQELAQQREDSYLKIIEDIRKLKELTMRECVSAVPRKRILEIEISKVMERIKKTRLLCEACDEYVVLAGEEDEEMEEESDNNNKISIGNDIDSIDENKEMD